jgi:hypothetical protein
MSTNLTFCDQCGKPTLRGASKFCSSCGAELPTGDNAVTGNEGTQPIAPHSLDQSSSVDNQAKCLYCGIDMGDKSEMLSWPGWEKKGEKLRCAECDGHFTVVNGQMIKALWEPHDFWTLFHMRQVFGVLFCLSIYFIPFGVGLLRDRRAKLALFFVNLIGGWTAIIWVIALIWALIPRSGSRS